MIEERFEKLLKPLVVISIVIIMLFIYMDGMPNTVLALTKYISYIALIDTVIFFVYYKFMWKYIPWNRPPVLKKKYNGKIIYNFDGVHGIKDIYITVKQSWLSLNIKASTDINSSESITANIIEEHGGYVLYYTYITNPDATVMENNPIQYGSCRMNIDEENGILSGKYWTSSKTLGDIKWE